MSKFIKNKKSLINFKKAYRNFRTNDDVIKEFYRSLEARKNA